VSCRASVPEAAYFSVCSLSGVFEGGGAGVSGSIAIGLAVGVPSAMFWLAVIRTTIGFNLMFVIEGPFWTAGFVLLCLGVISVHGPLAGVLGMLMALGVVVGWIMTVMGATDLWRMARGHGSALDSPPG
jgi:hypothetical protein